MQLSKEEIEKYEKSLVNKIEKYLKGAKIQLNEVESLLIEVLNLCSKCSDGTNIRRKKIVDQILEIIPNVSFVTVYRLLKLSEELETRLEYEGLRQDQVMYIKTLEHHYERLYEKWVKTDQTWYYVELMKAFRLILEIKGILKEKTQKIEYDKWKMKTLVVSDDPKYIKGRKAPLQIDTNDL